MAARVTEVGTIITRTQYLLRCGVLKERPLWLDVVETFPPFIPTKQNRKPEPGKPQLLRYKEDELRREVHKNFILGHRHAGSGSTVQEPVYSLYEDRPHTTLSDRFVQSLSTRVSNGEAIEEAAFKVAAELSDRENVIQAKEETTKHTALEKTVQSLEESIKGFIL